MNVYALVGKSLGHSFSQRYFTQKFKELGLSDSHIYINIELASLDDLPEKLLSKPDLRGFNVTIPYKIAILPYLIELAPSAQQVGAVNTVKVENGKLTGYNTDVQGFTDTIKDWVPNGIQALVLGSGGASLAVRAGLNQLRIPYKTVSRGSSTGNFTYEQLWQQPHLLGEYQLLINTTPLGTYPNITDCPNLPYAALTKQHYLYDLVYNPTETQFMKEGLARGAQVKNGYEMLVGQAEAAWKIWQS